MTAWHTKAACTGTPTDAWFPDDDDTTAIETAKAICAACTVRRDCLHDALSTPWLAYGIFGGLTAHERRATQPRHSQPPRRPAWPAATAARDLTAALAIWDRARAEWFWSYLAWAQEQAVAA